MPLVNGRSQITFGIRSATAAHDDDDAERNVRGGNYAASDDDNAS